MLLVSSVAEARDIISTRKSQNKQQCFREIRMKGQQKETKRRGVKLKR